MHCRPCAMARNDTRWRNRARRCKCGVVFCPGPFARNRNNNGRGYCSDECIEKQGWIKSVQNMRNKERAGQLWRLPLSLIQEIHSQVELERLLKKASRKERSK
jgi:hypothetical protein